MIFADKLVQLRKKAGWSQEELAEQMNVARQSVSKWEGAQSVPDLEKVIRLSELFGVSTDYLLKDEIEDADCLSSSDELPSLRRVTMEEANAFLSVKAATSKKIAYAVLLCILSPICLLVLGAVSETPGYGLSDNAAVGIGMIVLLAHVAAAVAIFISSGSKTAPYAYLEEEAFETEYGVSGMAKERREQYRGTYTRNIMIGVSLCLASLIPFFAGIAFNEENVLLIVIMLSVFIAVAGIGVFFLVRSGILWESYEKLLQEGDYTKEKKKTQSVVSAVFTVYWLGAAAIYLAYSFFTNDWGRSWIIWAVAGAAFPAVVAATNAIIRRK